MSNHLTREVAVGGVSNAVFNGLIAWLMLRDTAPLGWDRFAPDVIATAFILPLIVALIIVPLHRRKLARGALAPLRLAEGSVMQLVADSLPGRTFRCALAFGLIGALVIAPATLLGFYLAGVSSVSPAHYAVFKGLWAGVMAGVLVIPMVLVGLRDESQARGASQATG